MTPVQNLSCFLNIGIFLVSSDRRSRNSRLDIALLIIKTAYTCSRLIPRYDLSPLFPFSLSKAARPCTDSIVQVECFLLHAEAQSSGLNLVNATHVFLCEPLVNTAIELQAIARVHRIGQRRPTTVWMYLVSDTVEQSIYELSVSRRQDHIIQKERQRESHSTMSQQGDTAFEKHVTESTVSSKDGTNMNVAVTEVAIDSANSSEIQDAPLSRLMAGGSGGEIVKKDDLWQCLFGRTSKTKEALYGSDNAHREVARFLRGEAAEVRRTNPTSP